MPTIILSRINAVFFMKFRCSLALNTHTDKPWVTGGVGCWSVPEHVSGAERWEFPLPAHVGVRSTAQSHSRPLRSIPLPAHLQFHPAPVKSLHARSHLKFLCMPNTCLTSTEALGHTVCVADLERVCCITAAEKSASLLLLRGCGVVGPRTWYAHILQAVWLH